MNFPVIGKFKKTAQRVTCLNALPGLGTVVEAYTYDPNRGIPHTITRGEVTSAKKH